MYILGFILFVIGALVGYFGKRVYQYIFKKEANETETLITKAIGLAVFLIGTIIIFVFLR